MKTRTIGYIDLDDDFEALCFACAPDDADDLDSFLPLVDMTPDDPAPTCSGCDGDCTTDTE